MQKGPIAAAPEPTVHASSWELLARFRRDWMLPRKGEVALTALLMALLAATSGSYAWVAKIAVDALANGKPAPGALEWVIAVIVGVTTLRAAIMYVQRLVTNRTINRIGLDLQRRGYAHLVDADFDRLGRETAGHLVSRLTNDINAVQTATLALLSSSVLDALTVIGLLGWMLWIDWQLTLLVLGIYPLAAAPILWISERLRKVAKRTQVELADMTSQLTESLSGARLIKTYRLEDYAKERTNASFRQIYKLRMKAATTKTFVDPMLELMAGLALAGVTAFVGYHRMASGGGTIGDFFGFFAALALAAKPIQGFGGLPPKLQEGLAALDRMYEMLDEKPRIIDAPGAKPLAGGKGAIRFDHVTFAYGDNKPAVSDFTLDIPGGATVALVGRSGAGKSTIVNLVPRLFETTAGSISIDGQDIRGLTLASLRDAIAIVSQDITLFNDSVRANIALGKLNAGDEAVRAAASAAAAEAFITALPDGFATVIGDRGMRLSGGQRQRLALARAILRDAPILLLDEATSALDTESERAVQEALARFSTGRTTLVIAHRLSTVQNADIICVMDDGRLVETGRHTDLLSRDGAYARLVKQQGLGEPGG